MKLFTALAIPPHIAGARAPFVTGQPLNNLHITPAYIGDVPDSRFFAVERALAERPASGPLPLVVEGIGYFPDADSARVIWAGVKPVEPLQEIARTIRTALTGAGVRLPVDARPYMLRVTLARLYESQPGTLRHPTPFGYFEAHEFYLYLSNRGTYTRLSSFRCDQAHYTPLSCSENQGSR